MAYFPFFIDPSQMEGLVVGGGTVALRKVRRLLEYGARLTVCASSFLPAFEALSGVTLLRRPFRPHVVKGFQYVIAATNYRQGNRDIGALCRARGIPVNVVDDRSACTFLFPALVRRGELTIGISTGGASPSAAVYWKKRIAGLLPDDTADMLAYLDSLREIIKQSVPEEKTRAVIFTALFTHCMEKGWPLSEQELSALLSMSTTGTEDTP